MTTPSKSKKRFFIMTGMQFILRSFFKRKSITKIGLFYTQRGDYKLLQQVDADNQGVGVLDYKFFLRLLCDSSVSSTRFGLVLFLWRVVKEVLTLELGEDGSDFTVFVFFTEYILGCCEIGIEG